MSRAQPPGGVATILTAARRATDLDALAGGLQVDVLVVGGGATGTGAALDAASRGLSVALLERRDLATGTSRRRMAQDAVDRVVARPGVAAGPCRTPDLPLVGAPAGPVSHALPPRLLRRFGAEAAEVAALADGRPELLGPLAPGVPALGVEVLAARDREGALALDDVLERRTRLGLVPAWREAAHDAVARLLPELAEVPA